MPNQNNKNMDIFDHLRFTRDFSRNPKVAVNSLNEYLSRNPKAFKDIWQNMPRGVSSHQFISNFFKLPCSSEEILTFFYENERELLIKVIKETKSFLKPLHYQIMQQLFINDKIFLSELLFWKNIWEEMYGLINKNTFLAKHDFEETLIFCGLYYENLKIALGRSYHRDDDIIEVINEILSDKMLQVKKEKGEIKTSQDNISFYKKQVDLLYYIIENGEEDISSLFEIYKTLINLKFCYDNYIVQDFKISILNELTTNIKPENEHKYLKYKNAGDRYTSLQMLYSAREFEVFENEMDEIENAPINFSDKMFYKAVLHQMFQYIDAGFPEIVSIKGKLYLDPEACLKVINIIDKISNHRWNNAVEMSIINRTEEIPYFILLNISRDYYKLNESISLPTVMDNVDEFAELVDEMIKVTKGSSKKSILLFADQIDKDRNTRIDLKSKPFIVIGGNVYWISGILSNRNYSVMLQNNLLETDTQKAAGGIIDQYSKSAEEELAFRFEINNYNTKLNYKYSYRNGGEIDVIAFKNNTLFICQVKSTFHRSTVREISEHFTNSKTGIGKAIEQLGKDIDYVQNNWNEVQKQLDVDIDYNKIKIVPLAVTTTLEDDIGDIVIAGHKGHIVPLIDMRIILSNWKRYLYMNYMEIALNEKYQNNIPTEIKEVLSGLREDEEITKQLADITVHYLKQDKSKLHHSLWDDGVDHCSPIDLLNAIQKGKVWDFLEGKKSLIMNSIAVGRYTLNSLE